jgi:hypothetical protein
MISRGRLLHNMVNVVAFRRLSNTILQLFERLWPIEIGFNKWIFVVKPSGGFRRRFQRGQILSRRPNGGVARGSRQPPRSKLNKGIAQRFGERLGWRNLRRPLRRRIASLTSPARLKLSAIARSGGHPGMFGLVPSPRLGDQSRRGRVVLEQRQMRRDIFRAPKSRPFRPGQIERADPQRTSDGARQHRAIAREPGQPARIKRLLRACLVAFVSFRAAALRQGSASE